MIIIRRLKIFSVSFALCFAFLISVIFTIAFIKSGDYTYMAVDQRTSDKTVRRTITDRNMIPLTGSEPRYEKDTLAKHVIGYTDSSNTGISGIEKALDYHIRTDESMQYPALKDANGNDISVFQPSSAKGEKYIKLTLDYHIQKITENVLDKYGGSGAAVVLEADTFDVLAIASRPDFEQSNIGAYIQSGGTELLNRAISRYNAGSIFKIVTMAASLEEGICPSSLFCGGAEIYDNIIFPCHNPNGHGWLTPDDALAKSCNCAFYQIGTALGSEVLCKYAEKFGLGKSALGGILSESKGNVPKFLAKNTSEAANLSIGQGEILITPVQAAKIACIIASGGISDNVNIADSICYENGSIYEMLRQKNPERIISEENAKRIGEMMIKTTLDGTGTNAKSEKVSIAGKTGSAETGWQTEEGYMVQGWFIGFFPYESPKYAMAVMTENGRGGNISCAPVFKEIAEKITELNY